MKSHLDIEIEARAGEGFKPLVLPDDFSLSAEESNPVFNDTSFFSYPCQVSTAQNMAVLKNIAHRDSALRGMDFEHARARVVADGLPLNSGQVITSEDAEIGPTFDFNIDAQTESFSDLIGDLECQDVKVKDHIVIGEKIGKIRYRYSVNGEEYYFDSQTGRTATAPYPKEMPVGKILPSYENKFAFSGDGDTDSVQALGFSYPARCKGFPKADMNNGETVITESFINVSLPYPFPYCNSRVAYAHPGVKTNSDGTQETDGAVKGNDHNPNNPNDYGQYWCLDAFRQQSGICFYVLYFLDCLFEQLGVVFDKTELLEIEDFSRLAFFNTQCRFYEEQKHYNISFNNNGASYASLADALVAVPAEDRTPGIDVVYKKTDGTYVRYTPNDKTVWSSNPSDWSGPLVAEVLTDSEVKEWLESRKTGGELKISIYVGKPNRRNANYEEYTELPKEYAEDSGTFSHDDIYSAFPVNVTFNPPRDRGDWATYMEYHRKVSGEVHFETEIYDMVANSENFPKITVKSVIDSLEKSFGIRFLYDPEKRLVTARLLRNIYNSNAPINFMGKVLSMVPINEKITGIRMAYSAESDAKEQRNNVRYGIKDYDTDYDYIEYPKERTVTDLTYQTITTKVASTNINVYVDQLTGDRYRIKVNAEAEDVLSLKPTLFQVGQWKGVELGDCSEQNKNYVREFISDITPLDLNVINAKDYNGDSSGSVEPVLAPFLDVDMEHELLPQRINSVAKDIPDARTTKVRETNYTGDGDYYAFPEHIQILCAQTLKLVESYDPTQTKSGNSPLQDIEWGLTLAIMRGPGSGTSGYVNPDGTSSEVIGITWGEFKEIMQKNFGPVSGYRFYDDRRIGDFYDSLLSMSESEVIDDITGLTIGALKSALDVAFIMGVGRQTKGWWLYDVLYYVLISHSIGYFWTINNRQTYNQTVVDAVNEFLSGEYSGYYIVPMINELNNRIAAGTITRSDVILSDCNLTVGLFLDELNAAYNVNMVNISWIGVYSDYLISQSRCEYKSPQNATPSTSGVGTGTGSQIINYDRGYDGFDNSKWRQTVGIYAMTSDSLTPKGEQFDYNSQEEGVGNGNERISLMIRSWIQPDWADAPLCVDDERDEHGNITYRIRSRGLCDMFMMPHFYFLLHRKKYKVKALATIAQLLDIRNHWENRYIIDGKVGYINKIRYNISRAEGVKDVEMEFYSI